MNMQQDPVLGEGNGRIRKPTYRMTLRSEYCMVMPGGRYPPLLIRCPSRSRVAWSPERWVRESSATSSMRLCP